MAEVKKTVAKKPATKPAVKKAPAKPAVKKAPAKVVAKPVAKPAVKKAPAKAVAKPTPNASLPKKVFGVKVNTQAIFDTIMSERASRRQGTHKVKNKGEVSGTGKKPWAQKGTGRARAASLRSNVFVGGGVAFGPTNNRNYNLKINKKVRIVALNSALTLKNKDGAVVVKEMALKEISTKALLAQIKTMKLDGKKVLIVTEDMKVFRSASNIKKVDTRKLSSLSVESVINADYLVISQADIDKLEGKVK
ncbi:MAG: 50S ribosomal protein L4 [Mycoplasmataceae bacterium]|nr:50S ribosomal protein L4 [Mycoplasmataceae bacterium]